MESVWWVELNQMKSWELDQPIGSHFSDSLHKIVVLKKKKKKKCIKR